VGYNAASLGILIPSFPGKVVSSSSRAEMFKKRKFHPMKMTKVRRFGILLDSMKLRIVPEEGNPSFGGFFKM
jgi:hypothetical protein